jgi:dTDP-4-dehydrorhamnose 3,5-epimerase
MARPHIEPQRVHGCFKLTPERFNDHRGSFYESFAGWWHVPDMPRYWAQDNVSINIKSGVLRGLHIQRKNPMGKLVYCLRGEIFDVCLDLRRGTSSFMQHAAVSLKPGQALYCPPGTAHGFLATEPETLVHYKCSTLYDKDTDGGVLAFDPELGIRWPETAEYATMSDKDRALPTMREWLSDPRGVWHGDVSSV